MKFEPSKPESYKDATDDELLWSMCHRTRDIGWALFSELLKRQVARVNEMTRKFNQSGAEQAQQTILLSKSALGVAFLQVIIAVLTGGFGLWLTWKINSDAIARDHAKALAQQQAIINGMQWEVGIAKSECTAFLKDEKGMAEHLGSPSWIAQTAQVQRGLNSGLFYDDPDAAGTLEWILTLATSLNEHNHTMASAAVDSLPEANRAHFLKTNLANYGQTCSKLVKAIDSDFPAVLAHARAKGLDTKDVTEIAPAESVAKRNSTKAQRGSK